MATPCARLSIFCAVCVPCDWNLHAAELHLAVRILCIGCSHAVRSQGPGSCPCHVQLLSGFVYHSTRTILASLLDSPVQCGIHPHQTVADENEVTENHTWGTLVPPVDISEHQRPKNLHVQFVGWRGFHRCTQFAAMLQARCRLRARCPAGHTMPTKGWSSRRRDHMNREL